MDKTDDLFKNVCLSVEEMSRLHGLIYAEIKRNERDIYLHDLVKMDSSIYSDENKMLSRLSNKLETAICHDDNHLIMEYRNYIDFYYQEVVTLDELFDCIRAESQIKNWLAMEYSMNRIDMYVLNLLNEYSIEAMKKIIKDNGFDKNVKFSH